MESGVKRRVLAADEDADRLPRRPRRRPRRPHDPARRRLGRRRSRTMSPSRSAQIFLRLLFMLVIPLLFSALVVGIAEMGDVRSLKRVGIKTLVYTIVLSVDRGADRAGRRQPARSPAPASIRPRPRRCSPDAASAPAQIVATTGEQPAARRRLAQHHPDQRHHRRVGQRHPRGDVLRSRLRHRPAAGQHARARAGCRTRSQGLFDVTMRLIGIVIRLAPLAIACFMFNLAAVFGWDLLVRLGAYVGVVLLALGLHMFVDLSARARAARRRSRRSPSSARCRRRW